MGDQNTAPRRINKGEGELGQVMQSSGPGAVETWQSNPSSVTLVVAASNSLHPERADYQCDGTNDHLEIQEALDALPDTGGEVHLLDGTYNVEATVNLDSNQTLRGCGRNTILATATPDLIFLSAVGGPATELTGIVIAELQIDGGAGAVSDCGIYFEYVDYSFIQNVYSRRHAAGVGTILAGICLDNSDFNQIVNNICQGNGYNGIYIYASSDNTISGNTCPGNTNNGIYIDSSSSNTISGNTCQGHGFNGIYIYASSDNTISGNTCPGNTNNGIYIDSSSDNTICSNTCQGNGGNTGINIYLSSNNTICGNTCQGNGYHGILIDSSSDNTATGNTCQGNDYQGILIYLSSDNTISGNTCQENTFNGINLAESSERNTVSGNNCSRNGECGICFHTTSNNTIAGNLCQKNGRYGIVFVTASNNTISGNTIVENSQMDDIRDDNINLQTNSNYNLFTGNVCRKASVSTTLTGAHNIGVTAITLASTAGFRAGGGITFNPGGGNDETKIVATIPDATHLTITLGLTNDHINAEPVIVPRTRYGIYIWDANCIKNLLIGNDLYDAGNTANLNDGGTLTIVQDDNREIEITQVRHYINVKNTSGGDLAAGDVVTLKAVAAGNEITTTTTEGDQLVFGMVAEVIVDTASGLVLVKGKTTALKVNGTADIAIGDLIGCFTTVKIGMKAASGKMAFAIALEAYATNDSAGEIDALLITPRQAI